MESNFIENQNEADNLAFGQNGHRTLTGNSFEGEVFVAIVTESETAAYTAKSLAKKGDKSINKSTTAGHVLYGPFTDIAVSSGTVVAYLK